MRLYFLVGAHADDQPSTDDILVLAKRKKYTNHGEMFCAKHLKELTESVFDLVGHSVRIDIFSGKLNCDHIKTELSNGACILVAYPYQTNKQNKNKETEKKKKGAEWQSKTIK